MAKAVQTLGMPLYNGLAVGVNQYGQIEFPAWVPKLVAKTAAYTCKASESGTWFTNIGATTAVTFTLPAITDGPFYFRFLAGADVAITVAAGTADTAISFNDVAADSLAASTASEIVGASIEAICDGTSLWIIGPMSHKQTYTVAS